MTLTPTQASSVDISSPAFDNVLSLSNRELFWIARYVQPSDLLEHLPFLSGSKGFWNRKGPVRRISAVSDCRAAPGGLFGQMPGVPRAVILLARG